VNQHSTLRHNRACGPSPCEELGVLRRYIIDANADAGMLHLALFRSVLTIAVRSARESQSPFQKTDPDAEIRETY